MQIQIEGIPWPSQYPQLYSQPNRICFQREACIHCHLHIYQFHSTIA